MIFEGLIVNGYKTRMLTRHDPDGAVFYYSPEDFGLEYEEYDFIGQGGQKLSGYFYKKGEPRADKIVVFEHGMGCGHRAYMREISVIVEAGYLVFAYDHTGTLASGGENIGGLTQSLVDLDIAIKALKASGRTLGRDIAVIGHSWGGYSTMNIGAFHKDITHLVAMSGYPSVRTMLETMMTGIMSGYVPALFKSEADTFGGYAYADARYSLFTTNAKVMLIHSTDDPTAKYSMLEAVKDAICERENTVFLTLEGKKHNPTYTDDAVSYKDEFFAELTAARKKKMLSTPEARAEFRARFDFDRMTVQDMDVWNKIFAFLEG